MSFRLSTFHKSSCYRLPCRIQSNHYLPQPIFSHSFATSTIPQARTWRARNRCEDLLSNKKIKNKNKESASIDLNLARDNIGSSESCYGSQSIKAEILSLRRVEVQNPISYGYSGSKVYNRIHGCYVRQQQTGQERAYQNASRLRNEDIFGHQRQHYSYRLRLQQYMRQQKWDKKQRRYQSRGDAQEGHQGNSHNQWNLNSWWMWHLIESRKIVVRSLLAGIVFSGLGIWAYNTRSRYLKQWESFVEEAIRVKNDIEDIVDMTRTMSSRQSYSSAPKLPLTSLMVEDKQKAHLGSCDWKSYHSILKEPKMLSPEQVEVLLGKYQKSFRIVDQGPKHKNGARPSFGQRLVLGYSINLLASNSTMEDDSSQHVVRDENGEVERLFFGVYDGHSGWCCSQKVARELAPNISKELNNVSMKNPEAVKKAIEQGFLNLDQRIVYDSARRVLEHPSRPLACSSLLPAISGSCALMSYIYPKGGDLYVACTGDSRAVMGVHVTLPNGEYHWKAEPLSSDQTGRNQQEVKRLQQEHPGEDNTVVMSGRILGGLEPTRAFGDAKYKWSKDIQEKIFRLFPTYRQPYNNLKTPPYVTAKPVVTYRKIQPEDRFLIMATDGLWDKLTSDEAVQLVGDILDGKTGHCEMILDKEEIRMQNQIHCEPTRSPTLEISSEHYRLHSSQNENRRTEKELIPQNMTANNPVTQPRKFTYRDHANVSTHLIRNALGGAEDDKLAATLSIPSPMSRVYRDDITVTVIFFDRQDTTLALSDAKSTGGLIEITE